MRTHVVRAGDAGTNGERQLPVLATMTEMDHLDQNCYMLSAVAFSCTLIPRAHKTRARFQKVLDGTLTSKLLLAVAALAPLPPVEPRPKSHCKHAHDAKGRFKKDVDGTCPMPIVSHGCGYACPSSLELRSRNHQPVLARALALGLLMLKN